MKPPHLGADARHIRDLITAELAAYGITEFEVSRRKRHPVINFDAGGKHISFTIPGTPSDHRSAMNARGQVRRLVESYGLQRIEKPSRPPKPATLEIVQPVTPEVLSLSPSYNRSTECYLHSGDSPSINCQRCTAPYVTTTKSPGGTINKIFTSI